MASNPVEEFVTLSHKTAETRKTDEVKQLSLWKSTGNPDHLQPLFRAYEPVLNKAMQMYRAQSIPEAPFHAELKGHLIDAFHSYDPKFDTALNTHVTNYLRKAIRYNANNQNVARIPEGQIAKIAPITKAQNELSEVFGRAPTHHEIAEHIGIPVKQVSRVLKSQIADIASSKFESDPTSNELQRDEEIASLLSYSLEGQERLVFDHLYGDKKSATQKKRGQLAKELGLTDSKFSRLHSSILDKYRSYK